MKKYFIWACFAQIVFSSQLALAQVREVEVDHEKIVTVKTSLGIATIIQVEDTPTSVVVGDLDSFKVEYLDEAITIKPLSANAKSNLYIYTDWRRYNVKLVSVTRDLADYVVSLKPKRVNSKQSLTTPKNRETVTAPRWTRVDRYLRNEELRMTVKQVMASRDGLLWIEFEITQNANPPTESSDFDPAWVWVIQKQSTKPIHRLVLSSVKFGEAKKILGLLQLRISDLSASEPIRIELRRKRTGYLTLAGPDKWQR